mmetsp:Transcript_651/g.778  ORF Transcript_651/g.778 Transcript_651/m.778 type:complete len:180 (-) Transcript_651:163-702(-)|eukprot:CAMPEP_0194142892 /NCGR_PEP_ID=MMETSP0152-20130528/12102_1 /TAXON_ID=1049557 /ORGANISM="Thalassiothrix antarctica, Strain L6-D1" /LENGTH=179 /DNA_ID=CAMNT_0038842039 /DNA_START=108 /DNA_END=650 /DNA_ORIENTATION=+
MNTFITLQFMMSLLGFHLAHGFAHHSTKKVVPGNTYKVRKSFLNQKTKNIFSRKPSGLVLSASQDSNQDESDKPTDDEVPASEDYDFEAGFQARLEKEGGTRGVQAKAVKRSVDSAKNVVTAGLKESAQNSVDLLSGTEWNLTVGFLVLVVVLAIGTHLASPVPFETSSNGEQLGFGVR